MEKLKSQWERAHHSIGALGRARKLLGGAIIAIMIAVGAWLVTHPERAAIEPLLDQTFNDADVMQITSHLNAHNIPHEVRQGKVFVPSDRKMDALSDLLHAQVVTGNTESGFDAMIIKQGSIFDSPSKTDKMFNHARELMLANVIGRWGGVRKATVLIDPTSERHIGGSIEPSALVDIQIRAGETINRRQLADAAVKAVTGAVSAMPRQKVKVTIDGASYSVGDEELAGGINGDVLERRQECEQAYAAKVRNLLSYIPDVLVSVSIDLNLQSHEEEKRVIDPDKSVHLETRVQTRTEQPSDSIDADAEIGVLANAVPDLVETPENAKPQAKGKTVTAEYFNRASETVQKTRTPAGKETVLSASVAVPRSYIVGIYQRSAKNPQARPDDALIQPIVDAQLGKIRGLVRTSLGLRNEDVTVEVYEDAPAVALASAATTTQAAVVPMVLSLSKHGREISYAAAAVAGVVVMSLVLRRGHAGWNGSTNHRNAAQPLPASSRVRVAPVVVSVPSGQLDADEDEGNDDLLRQVRELAARQPDAAARVLRQWIQQD